MSSQAVAVVASGGKQYTVKPGDIIVVAKMDTESGKTVSLADLINGKKVSATVVEHGRLPKIQGRLFRNKVRGSRFPRGHKQPYTSLKINAIK